jgi:transposase
MRGDDLNQTAMFSYISPEQRVPCDHPLRAIRQMTDRALASVSPLFEGLYSRIGRPSIPPEKLLRALLLQVLYTIRSERLLMEQLDYNLLLRWFVGMNTDDRVWNVTVFSKNRERLLGADIAREFFAAVLEQAREKELLSDEHFTVDGTLLEAWASRKSFQAKEKPPEKGSGSRGKPLLNETHSSTTDPDARMYKKSKGGESKLCYLGHVLTENRNGLVVAGVVTHAGQAVEETAGVALVKEVARPGRRVTVGADKAYDSEQFVAGLRALNATPHVAQYEGRGGTHIDRRTTRHSGYEVSLKKRKLVEEVFGWVKTVAGLRKMRFRGLERVNWIFHLALAGCNLVRMRRLLYEA